MKRIYFVRHGSTQGNEIDAYQKLDSPLSEAGRSQASFLAERFSKISFDALIASNMERAQETARAIARKTGHKVVTEALFHELLRPSVARGKSRTDRETMEIMQVVNSYWEKEGERHSDEENFFDLRNRAIEALQYLISRSEETIAVVTHGTILRMMIFVMICGENVQPDLWENIDTFFSLKNTGITWVEYDTQEYPNRWRLVTWNDHAHLG